MKKISREERFNKLMKLKKAELQDQLFLALNVIELMVEKPNNQIRPELINNILNIDTT